MDEIKLKNIVFKQRPIPIPVDYRPVYKIAQIILVLKICCRNEQSSLAKLHLFIWAMKNDVNMQKVINSITSNFNNTVEVWGMEPSLNRALDYAIFENLCEILDGKIKLTNKGDIFFEKIIQDKNILQKEIDFLKFVKKRFSEERVQKNIDKWELKNVKNQSN